MLGLRKTLVSELVTTENCFMIKDLVELWPEIRYQHNSRFFKDVLKIADKWPGYDYSDFPGDKNDRLEISKQGFFGPNFFRFAIYVGESDTNWWFGIVGPWKVANKFPEINLINGCTALNWRIWKDWYWSRFAAAQRLSIYQIWASTGNSSPAIETMFKAMSDEFLGQCRLLKDKVERINACLQAA